MAAAFVAPLPWPCPCSEKAVAWRAALTLDGQPPQDRQLQVIWALYRQGKLPVCAHWQRLAAYPFQPTSGSPLPALAQHQPHSECKEAAQEVASMTRL